MILEGTDRARQAEDEAYAREFARAAAPVKRDLASVGFHVEALSELARGRKSYRRAVPVLLEWVTRTEHDGVREVLLRLLADRSARPEAAGPLVEFFRRQPAGAESVKWLIANALTVVAADEVYDELAALIRDPESGDARPRLVDALRRMKDPRAFDFAVELLADEGVDVNAARVAAHLGGSRALPHLERLPEPDSAWARRELRRLTDRLRQI